MCKNSIKPGVNAGIPIFESASETMLGLVKYLSAKLLLKSHEHPQACSICHKSLLNFYFVTNLLSIFDEGVQDTIVENELPQTSDEICGRNSSGNFRIDVKREDIVDWIQDIKKEDTVDCTREVKEITDCTPDVIKDFTDCTQDEENTVDCTLVVKYEDTIDSISDMKEETQIDVVYNELQFKNRRVDLKMEDLEAGVGLLREEKNQNFTLPKFSCCVVKSPATSKNPNELICNICQFTTCKESMNNHMLLHKDINEVEIFQCDVCKFQSKYKSSLNSHMMNHKRSGNVSM